MKNLLDKLTNEQLDVLDAYETMYPSIYKTITESLYKHNFCIQLPFGDALNIYRVFYSDEKFDADKMFELFDNEDKELEQNTCAVCDKPIENNKIICSIECLRKDLYD